MAYKRLLQNGAMTFALLLTMLVIPAATAQARDRYDVCRDRIHTQEQKFERAVQRHGVRSRQAEKARFKLREIRAKCGEVRRDRDHDHDHDDHFSHYNHFYPWR